MLTKKTAADPAEFARKSCYLLPTSLTLLPDPVFLSSVLAEMTNTPSSIVYIMSDNRSGSTLLDQLLGAHSKIRSLGEVHHLRAYALGDRSLYNPAHPLVCSCDQEIGQCPFWSNVESRLARPLASLTLKPRLFRREAGPGRRYPRSYLMRHPRLYRFSLIARLLDSQRVAADSFALFDAIFEVSAVRYLIDSSKNPFRFRALYDSHPARMLLVMLGRDYRGTVYSKMKRGRDLQSSARGWASRMKQMEALTCDVPRQQLIRVKYEDLCCNPRATLEQLCSFLQVGFEDEMLSRPFHDLHHLGGSPSKFDASRSEIRLDTTCRRAFSENELSTMRAIVQDTAERWGYD